MRLRIKYDEFMTLLSLLQQYAQMEMPVDINDRLVRTILHRAYKRFYQQACEKKQRYTIKLSPEEAMAFWITFSDHGLPIASFEGNLLTTLTNSIHKNFVV